MAASTFFLGLLASASFVTASPTSRWTLHESRASAPSSFSRVGAAPADKVINLRINLAGNDISGLEDKLNTVSDPASGTFRQWLSKEEVETYSKPSEETSDAISSWLTSHGLTAEKITPAGDWISVKLPVNKAEELLNTKYSVYTHKSSGKQAIRTLEYSLPQDIAPHVRAMHPTNSYVFSDSYYTRFLTINSISFNGPVKGSSVYEVKAKKQRAAPVVDTRATSACSSSAITPACLQSLYSIPTTPATAKNNSMGVTAYSDQYANQADLTLFLKKYRTDMSSATAFTLTSVDGGTNSQTASKAGVEAVSTRFGR